MESFAPLSATSSTHDNGAQGSVNPSFHRSVLSSSSSLSPSRPRKPSDLIRPVEKATKSKPLKHSNSCSTIYVDDSTVSQPNWKAMIKCVSIAIHSHILHRKSNKTMNIFDEKLHPLTVNSRQSRLFSIDLRRLILARSDSR